MAKKTTGEERGAALQRLKAALKSGGVGNFYVFFGEEAFLKEHPENNAVKDFIANQRYEQSLYHKYKEYYGYVFYIGQKR